MPNRYSRLQRISSAVAAVVDACLIVIASIAGTVYGIAERLIARTLGEQLIARTLGERFIARTLGEPIRARRPRHAFTFEGLAQVEGTVLCDKNQVATKDTVMFDADSMEKLHNAFDNKRVGVVDVRGFALDSDDSDEETLPTEEEMAELNRLAREHADFMAEIAAAKHAQSSGSQHTLDPDAVVLGDDELTRIAATFNEDRKPGVTQLATSRRGEKVAMGLYTSHDGAVKADPEALPVLHERIEGLSRPLTLRQDFLQLASTGGAVWPISRVLARYLGAALARGKSSAAASTLAEFGSVHAPAGLRDVTSVLELGCGIGLVSLAIAAGGVGHVARVVATDGEEGACELCRANGEANLVPAGRLAVAQYRWGEHAEASAQLRRVLALCSGASSDGGDDDAAAIDAAAIEESITAGGGVDDEHPRPPAAAASTARPRCARLRCAELIVAADVLYMEAGIQLHGLLATSIRRLIGAGGCKYVLIAWYDRLQDEANFLSGYLGDLGEARTLWTGGDDGRMGISLLEVRPIPPPEPEAVSKPEREAVQEALVSTPAATTGARKKNNAKSKNNQRKRQHGSVTARNQ